MIRHDSAAGERLPGQPGAALDPGAAMAADARVALARWSASGAMALTGDADGPPLARPARVALALDHWAELLAARTAEVGAEVRIDGAALLGERAAHTGWSRRGSTSVGGACRMLPASDGWLALSLARDDDVALLPAWLGADPGPTNGPEERWQWVAALIRERPLGELVSMAALLGVPCGQVGEVAASDVPLVRFRPAHGIGSAAGNPPPGLSGACVVDLSSLWAGPLCGHLLGLAGARVVKVESTRRPDGARSGPPGFFDLLHAGQEMVALDFSTERGRTDLRRLLAAADVVIEASRPRALELLGCAHDDAVATGFAGLWVSITAFGRSGEHGCRVGFGDDAAAAGGLAVRDPGPGPGTVPAAPRFVADAVADPATGLLAATAAATALASGRRGLLELTLAGTAAHLAAGVAAGEVAGPAIHASGGTPAAAPRSRPAAGRAGAMGADTDAVLRSW